jgi:hypothetical protein
VGARLADGECIGAITGWQGTPIAEWHAQRLTATGAPKRQQDGTNELASKGIAQRGFRRRPGSVGDLLAERRPDEFDFRRGIVTQSKFCKYLAILNFRGVLRLDVLQSRSLSRWKDEIALELTPSATSFFFC